MSQEHTSSDQAGKGGQKGALFYALGAHVVWGSMPLYLMLVASVPAFEFVAWRLIFTLPLCLVLMAIFTGFAEFRAVLRNPRAMLTLLGSSIAIAINWLLYVHAIQSGYVYAASLGYYILPLVMMVFGMVFLSERLSKLQWWAVGLAAVGVAALSAGALTTLWLSVSMGISFGIYGLLRKTVAAGSLAGLTMETLILTPFAAAVLIWFGMTPQGPAMAQGWNVALAIAFSGPMTAVPLLMFATAARRMPYTVIGFLQFFSPTIVFLFGLLVFDEQLKPAQLVSFVLIWSAAALFSWELLRGKKTDTAA